MWVAEEDSCAGEWGHGCGEEERERKEPQQVGGEAGFPDPRMLGWRWLANLGVFVCRKECPFHARF